MRRTISFPGMPPGWSRHGELYLPDRDAPRICRYGSGAGAIAAAGQRVKPIDPTTIGSCVAYFSMHENDSGTYTVTAGSPDTVTSITNQVSSAAWNTASVANFPEYVASGINGHPAMIGNVASNCGIRSTEAAVVNPFTGDDSAVTVIAVIAPTQVATTNTSVFGAGNSAVNTADFWRFGTGISGGGRWTIVKSDPGATAVTVFGASAVPTLVPHIVTWVVPGTTVRFYEDQRPSGSSVALDVGAMTCNRVALLNKPDVSPDNPYDGYLGALAVFSAALTSAQRRGVEQFFFDAWF